MKHASLTLAVAIATTIFANGCSTFKSKQNETQSKDKTKEEEKLPFLTRPEVRTIWVPDSVEGNRYIEGHRVFIIDKNSSWSKDHD